VYKHLAFWLDAEDFSKHLPGHHAFRNSQARKLISKYIADDAHMKVAPWPPESGHECSLRKDHLDMMSTFHH
jgi:hypothetical protein